MLDWPPVLSWCRILIHQTRHVCWKLGIEWADPPRIDGWILPYLATGNVFPYMIYIYIWYISIYDVHVQWENPIKRDIRNTLIEVVSPFIGEYQWGNSVEYPRVLEQTNSSLWKINHLYIIREIMGLHPSRTAYPTGPTLLALHQFEVSGNHSHLATWICNCRVNWQFDVEHQSGYHWCLQGNHPFLWPYPLVIEHSYGKSLFLMGKSTISMAIFQFAMLIY